MGVITMLSPFCGAMLHPDPNSIPGNPLEDVRILLLTHISRSESMRVFRTTKARVLSTKQVTICQREWDDASGAVQTQALFMNTVLALECWGLTTGHIFTAPSRNEISGKKKNQKVTTSQTQKLNDIFVFDLEAFPTEK